jgi:AcrR family transcriptional regulator
VAIALVSAPRPGPRPRTSRQEIVRCAIRMLDREGPEALTFRAVARELGIAVGALSRYFRNLADLKDEVAAKIMAAVRPLDAAGKLELREQLVRLGMDWLEINRAHPYLVAIHGPASATMFARQTGQCLRVLMEVGIDVERALAIYSMVGNLAYAWGVQSARRESPELQAKIMQAFSDELGELAPQMTRWAAAATSTSMYRRSLRLLVHGLLPAKPTVGKSR